MGYQRYIKSGQNDNVKECRNGLLIHKNLKSGHLPATSDLLRPAEIKLPSGPVRDFSTLWPEAYYKFAFSILLLSIMMLGGLLYRNNYRSRDEIGRLKTTAADLRTCLDLAEDRQDWLIKEIHHRVKNNLQVIMSLLNTQTSYLTNDEAIKALRNSQHRLFAITLVHQKLYQTANLSSIDMVVYTHELVEYLHDEYGDYEKQITLKIDMVPLMLSVEMAVPFGLIINEAISNALKFAFPCQSTGQVNITLKSCNQIDYSFQIADNGIGFDKGKEAVRVDSFGNNLISGLARQLGGSCQVENAGGVKILLQFRKNQESETLAV